MTTKKMVSRSVAWLCLGGATLPFSVGAQGYSPGIKLNGLTISPYVNVELGYDSNIVLDHDRKLKDGYLRANPGVDFSHQGNEWGLAGSLWYSYAWYGEYEQKDYSRWGGSLRAYRESVKGWQLVGSIGYVESDQNDSWYYSDAGDGVWRNRRQFDGTVGLSYAFNQRFSAGLNLMYSDMWWGNKNNELGNLYGWSQWKVGGEISYRLTERYRALLSASYQEYYSDYDSMQVLFDDFGTPYTINRTTGRTSRNYTLMGGFMSDLTERIRYRALGGASLYEYGGTMSMAPSYSLDATWAINKRWAATITGAGYFQPSERTFEQKRTIYTIAGGLTYMPVERLTLKLDGIYRGEENQSANAYKLSGYTANYSRNQYTARFRASYRLQKYVSVYGSAEYTYQDSNRSQKDQWERYLLTVGLSLRY